MEALSLEVSEITALEAASFVFCTRKTHKGEATSINGNQEGMDTE